MRIKLVDTMIRPICCKCNFALMGGKSKLMYLVPCDDWTGNAKMYCGKCYQKVIKREKSV